LAWLGYPTKKLPTSPPTKFKISDEKKHE
jgi:hypothetical protein